MADEDLEKKADESTDEEESEEESSAAETSGNDSNDSSPPVADKLAKAEKSGSKGDTAEKTELSQDEDREENEEIDAALAAQTGNVLGSERFVYAAYLAAAVAASFIFSKLGHSAWTKLASWKPEQVGEPRDEIVYAIAGILGVGLAVHYWRKKEARQYATEVAEELSKVTWPTKKEVQSSTFIVVLTTLFATVFFALMDQFWRFITDKVYGF